MDDKNKNFKNKLKAIFGQTQWVYTDSRSIQEDSSIIKTHPTTLSLPQKGKTRGILLENRTVEQ